MSFVAGQTVTISTPQGKLTVKIEDASKGDVILAKVEQGGGGYQAGQVHEFRRDEIEAV